MPLDIAERIRKMKKKKSTVPGDVPWKLILEFADVLSYPLYDIFKRSLDTGEYANVWKFEYVTPVPKVFPPKTIDELRKISGITNFSKIFESFIAEIMVEDMKPNRDPSQYGNRKGISVQHYLINMIDKIMTALDSNTQKEAYAVIVSMVDWSKAFDRQCPTLGVQSFVNNGVRKSIIPLLTNYFQERKMKVKWHGLLSSERDLPGGGPQGCSIGLQEYDSQTNKNCDFVAEDERYKFVDDLSLLEIINLISIGLSSYNFKQHVASDIAVDELYLPAENIKSQDYMHQIESWTKSNKMKLNCQKIKVMIFNLTRNYQFSTRILLDNTLLEIIEETKLLGCVISSDLTWYRNTEYIVKRAYQRMVILNRLYSFCVPHDDLVTIYCLYIRSLLEQNSNVWASSITQEEIDDIESVQRVACRIILKDDYTGYTNALESLNLESLEARRQHLLLRFAKKSLKNPHSASMFPLNPNFSENPMENNRQTEKYKVNFASKGILYNSAIPSIQRALNKDFRDRK